MVVELHAFALIGFGEAGSILGADLAATGRAVSAYDILLDTPAGRERVLERARRAQVRVANTFAEAVRDARVVISAVTASSSGEVAAQAAKCLRPGQVLLDINSVSPAKKRSNAALFEAAGLDYVEAAVMAPVPPERLRVPMLLGGKQAVALADELRKVGMNTTALSDEIGVASAVKMCRSIVIKGLEALTVESMLAARRFGAEREVLESLQGTFPSLGWTDKLPDYLISRVAEHGRRRAAEMREVARTLEDVNVEPTLARAIAARQDWLADAMSDQGISYASLSLPFSWRELIDALAVTSPATPPSE
jgi:3-hydroxyisobutyrate dehydrogenase-like beta-hydroxyacid dehydrogenase